MSKLMKFFAVVLLFASVSVFAPTSADARWGGGWHGGGWHGGGWHGGWRGGWGGWRGGGWGWGPAFGWGVGPGWGWGPGWGNPYFYSAGPRCRWVPVRTWRSGHWWVGRAWRCW